MMQSISLSLANSLYNLANICLIISLVLGVVSTWGVVWMGKIKEDYSTQDLIKMQERTANAEKLTVEAQLELERLKKATEPRKITQAQQNFIQEKVKAFKGQKISFAVNPSTNETQWLLRHLPSPFAMAGWQLDMSSEDAIHNQFIPDGILIISTQHPKSIEMAKVISESLNEIGLYSTTFPNLFTKSVVPNDPDATRILIIIGDKPIYKISSYTDNGKEIIKNRLT